MTSHNNPPLVVHIIYALKAGGLENGLVNIINRTPPERYRHAIICLTEADDFTRRITAPGVEIIQLHKKEGHDFGLYWRVWRTLKILKPSIVHTRNLTSIEMQLMAALLPGVKRVHGEHGRDIDDLDGKSRKYNLLRKLLRPLIHRYIAVSRDLQEWLINTVKVPAEKIKQIYNGVDSSRFYPGTPDCKSILPDSFRNNGVLIVGTVGRLATVKNQQLLIHAFDRLTREQASLRNRLKLVMVGDGPDREQISQLINDLQLATDVWLTGNRSDVPQLLRAMDIFVLPSLAEGISNTILEAMATGLPVIATDVGGNPELIEDGIHGRLISSNDTAALSQAIGELASDRKVRAKLSDAVLKKVSSEFDWEKTVTAYLSVYDQLLQSHK